MILFYFSFIYYSLIPITILEPIQQRYLGGEVIFYLPLRPDCMLNV
jgi:hypothetical protein